MIKDLDALKIACDALGVTLAGAGNVRMYGSQTTRADHVIKLPGAYDIGFTDSRAASGTFDAVCDGEIMNAYNTGRNADAHRLLGVGLGRLKQEYSVAIAAAQARAQGYTMSRRAAEAHEEAGSIFVTLRK